MTHTAAAKAVGAAAKGNRGGKSDTDSVFPKCRRIGGSLARFRTYGGPLPAGYGPSMKPPSLSSFGNTSFVWFGAAIKPCPDICLTLRGPLIIGPPISHIVVRRRWPRRDF